MNEEFRSVKPMIDFYHSLICEGNYYFYLSMFFSAMRFGMHEKFKVCNGF